MRFIKSVFAMVLIATITLNTITIDAYAASNTLLESQVLTTADGRNIKMDVYENEIIFTTLDTGAVERVIQNDVYHLTYYNSDGQAHSITGDEKGNVYYDGVLTREVKQTTTTTILPPKSLNTLLSSSTSPWGSGWIYLNTTYVSQSLYDGTVGLALGLISFVPGLGTVATIAGLVVGFISMSRPTAYYKISQYGSSNYREVRERIYVYSVSNYTGYQGYVDTVPHSIF